MKVIRGFTLVEMAVVLMILGLLLGGLLIPLSAQMDQQKIRVTQQRLEEIKEALIGFVILKGRLPCPALDVNGKEASKIDVPTPKWICDTYDNSDGYLPWRDLGVDGYDAWGHPFRYRADGYFSNDEGIRNPPKAEKVLIVKDQQNQELNTYSSDDSRIVAIIFSCGKNGQPDPTPNSNLKDTNDADGITNSDAFCQNPGTANLSKKHYIQDVYVENQFDDILVWLPKSILINRLAVAGKWPQCSPAPCIPPLSSP